MQRGFLLPKRCGQGLLEWTGYEALNGGGGNGRRPLNKLYLMAQTDKQTDGHCDSETKSAQWADSVKRGVMFGTDWQAVASI